jgi:hypothetical protein
MSSEIELIRTQLTLEAMHAAQAVAAGAAAGAGERVRAAAVDYLAQVLAAFEERDQRVADLLHTRDLKTRSGALSACLTLDGTGRETLKRLEAAVRAATGAAWQEFARYFAQAWQARRAALDAALADSLAIGDWRRIAGLDSDSILAERRCYARLAVELQGAQERAR